jgi:hypothetical protein
MRNFTLKISALILALMLVLPTFSQVTLKYNFKKGDIFKQSIATNTDLTQKVMDQEMKIKISFNGKSTFEVKEVTNENYTLEMKYKELKMSVAMPGMDLSFDSNTPEDVATMQDFGPMLKVIVDKPVEIVLTKAGIVESVKGTDKLGEAMLNSLDENIPDASKQQLISQFGSQFSEEQFKSLFSQNAGYFSDKPVNTGDSWNYKLSTTTSNITFDIDTKMTLKSIAGDVVTIDAEGTFSTPEGYETEMNGMTAKVALKGAQKGLVKIDKNTGWIISSEMTQNFAGDMELMGMKIPISSISTTSISDN